jgi:RNA exonuclease 1
MHHAAVSVMKRPLPDSVKHPSVGTLRESRARVEAAAKEALSKLTYETCEQYILPVSEYADWGYPDPADDTLVHPPDMEPDAEGQEKTCDRCNALFIVSAKHKEERLRAKECRHHWGRLQPEQVEGRRKWLFTCCLKERGEEGCTDGLHVFREKDDDKALARREAYKTVKQVCGADGKDGQTSSVGSAEENGWLKVVAIDCEMICRFSSSASNGLLQVYCDMGSG